MSESDFIYHMRVKIFEEADKKETSIGLPPIKRTLS